MAPLHPNVLEQLQHVEEVVNGIHEGVNGAHERLHEVHEDVRAAIHDAIKNGIGNMKKLFGFNDGCIYPPSRFPAGTPLSVMRAAALAKDPVHGEFQTLVVLVEFPDRKFSAAHTTSYYQVTIRCAKALTFLPFLF